MAAAGKTTKPKSTHTQLNVRIPIWQMKQLQELAKAEDRSVTAVVRRALREYASRADGSA